MVVSASAALSKSSSSVVPVASKAASAVAMPSR